MQPMETETQNRRALRLMARMLRMIFTLTKAFLASEQISQIERDLREVDELLK